ncbi:iron-sulfur cluster co-chaperone protein HscB isoform X2 [Neocloeon triangulifer]|uniref:iron-sulfur cluster co-chaperone protein HscB isoform X2 n=1 Tax=Neocloeon triangulifer TaxID=2078957 RepID=UPI00286F9E64|nr:iron-sulfur cluster co-chaperone protein HscB isoform X2 [Neocloeon triangulifer]
MFLRHSARGSLSLLPLLSKLIFPETLAPSSRSRAIFKASKITCWQCGADKPLDNFFCKKCSALQEPDHTSSYFDVLGVEKKFDLKTAELTKKFRSLQSLVHPDKYGRKSENEKENSENHSALLNQAYKTLLKPMDRGLYLLKLEGLSIEEGTVQMDSEFLMEIMELNEELESASSSEAVLKLAEANNKVINQYTKDIDAAFEEKNLEKAKQLLTKMKYYSSFEEKIKELKRNLGIVS